MTKRAYVIALVLLLSLGSLMLGLRYMKGAPSSDIAYGSDIRNRLDVYAGSNCPAAGCPVMVAVHGGGWIGGDKIDFYHSRVAATLARQGLTLVVPNYRLAPANKHPAQIEDIALAIAWTYQNIKAYGGNPDRIYLMGHSAGAHLVALAGTNDYYLGRYNYKPEQLAGVISLDTTSLDLERRAHIWGSDDETRTNTFVSGSEHAASPFWHISEGRAYPPFLLIAASDTAESVRQAGAMAAKLVNIGSKAQSTALPYDGDNSHMRIFLDLASASSAVSQRIAAFVSATP